MKTFRINFLALMGVLAFAFGCSIASSAAAQSVSLKPIVDQLGGALTVVIGAFVTFLAGQVSLWLNKKLKLDGLKVDETVRSYLNEAALRGIQWAILKVGASDLTNIQVRSQVLALAAQYVVDRVPSALTRFGITTESLQQYLEARLGSFTIPSPAPVETSQVTPA